MPIVNNILDSFSCFLDFKVQGSGFHKQNFLGFRILEAKISWIQYSTSKNFLDSGFWKQKFPGFLYMGDVLHDWHHDEVDEVFQVFDCKLL